MSKILEASCVGGVVTADDLPVLTAEILSEGVGSSDGVLLMDEDKQYYLPNATGDLDTTLGEIIDSLDVIGTTLNTIATALTSIGAKMTGPTTSPPPTLPADVASIIANSVSLTAIKTQVQLLKGQLK